MAKKVPTKPTLILLYGFPGSGKTFFSRQFKDEINTAYINSEQLRYEFFAQPNYSKPENDVTDHLTYYMMEQFLLSGTSVIFDSNAARIADRRMLYEMAEKSKAEVLIVWFQIDIESAFARIAGRDRRKLDDKFARPLDRTTFEDVVNKMQNPSGKEDYVVVSGKHAFTTQKNTVFKKLYEKNLITLESAQVNVVKPELVNRIPNSMAGRVDPTRRNISIY